MAEDFSKLPMPPDYRDYEYVVTCATAQFTPMAMVSSSEGLTPLVTEPDRKPEPPPEPRPKPRSFERKFS